MLCIHALYFIKGRKKKPKFSFHHNEWSPFLACIFLAMLVTPEWRTQLAHTTNTAVNSRHKHIKSSKNEKTKNSLKQTEAKIPNAVHSLFFYIQILITRE